MGNHIFCCGNNTHSDHSKETTRERLKKIKENTKTLEDKMKQINETTKYLETSMNMILKNMNQQNTMRRQ